VRHVARGDFRLAEEQGAEEITADTTGYVCHDVDRAIILESEQAEDVAADVPERKCPGGYGDRAEDYDEKVVAANPAVRQQEGI